MKTTFLILITLSWIFHGMSQSCCSMTATEEFAMLTVDDAFKASHENPEPYTYEGEGKMITFDTPDGKKANAFVLTGEGRRRSWLFVFHEWWGLNDHIKQEAKKYYDQFGDVSVIALDLYDGKLADNGKDAASLMQSVDQVRASNIVKGAIEYVDGANIATVGWCFGGGWSLQGALLAEENAIGCIMYYGMPEKDVSRLKNLNSDVLGIFATKDQWINPEVVKTFEENMKAAGKKVTVHNYESEHAFANPSNPIYDETAAKDAFNKSIEYLKNKF